MFLIQNIIIIKINSLKSINTWQRKKYKKSNLSKIWYNATSLTAKGKSVFSRSQWSYPFSVDKTSAL